MAGFDDALRGYAFPIHQRDGFRCRYCGLDGTRSFANWLALSWDHLLPRGHPSRDNPDYIVTACMFCNTADNRYFDLAGKRGLQFDGLSPDELVTQRLGYVKQTRDSYRKFWAANVQSPENGSGPGPSPSARADPGAHDRMAHRRMRDPRFRQEQVDSLRAPHIAPVNGLVDELIDPSGRGWVPYVAPIYGGVNARVLFIARDPGPKTHTQHGGSGFLCLENDDATAERFATLLDGAGIPVGETLAWTPTPGTSTAHREQTNWRWASSHCGTYSASCPGSGW